MKYIVLLSDGMAGEPLKELQEKTTLEAADTPNMDRLSREALVGLAYMAPPDMAPGSDTANLAVMGYDPRKYYTGRSPLEALSVGAVMEESDVSLRMNLVTLSETEPYEEKKIIDHSAGEITTEEANVLLEAVKEGLACVGYEFYAGTSYRHLVVMKEAEVIELVPPHDILGQKIGEYLPQDAILREMMKKSNELLEKHPINQKRKEKGERPANSIWFWGAGKKPAFSNFHEKTGKRGIMISAVDLLKGIAIGAGMSVAKVKGITGGLHTNYEGKARAALHGLLMDDYDFAYIHVEAPDEMGHQGLIKEKIEAIEQVDKRVLGTLLEGLDKEKVDYRIMVLPDHLTPIEKRTHTSDPVPFLLYDSMSKREGVEAFNEKEAKGTGILLTEGYRLIQTLLK